MLGRGSAFSSDRRSAEPGRRVVWAGAGVSRTPNRLAPELRSMSGLRLLSELVRRPLVTGRWKLCRIPELGYIADDALGSREVDRLRERYQPAGSGRSSLVLRVHLVVDRVASHAVPGAAHLDRRCMFGRLVGARPAVRPKAAA